MIDRVLAATQVHFGECDAELPRELLDRLRLASECTEIRTEGVHVARELLRRVAFGIDAHEHHLEIGNLRDLHDVREARERGRANVRAMREAKEEQRGVALEGLRAERLTG